MCRVTNSARGQEWEFEEMWDALEFVSEATEVDVYKIYETVSQAMARGQDGVDFWAFTIVFGV